jgi:hypothetical protein
MIHSLKKHVAEHIMTHSRIMFPILYNAEIDGQV